VTIVHIAPSLLVILCVPCIISLQLMSSLIHYYNHNFLFLLFVFVTIFLSVPLASYFTILPLHLMTSLIHQVNHNFMLMTMTACKLRCCASPESLPSLSLVTSQLCCRRCCFVRSHGHFSLRVLFCLSRPA
jgi:hypothetical protein